MEAEQIHLRSHLFTVRLWLEPLGDGQSEWRGKVQHVLSGDAQYFRGWSSLQAFIVRRLEPLDGAADPAAKEQSPIVYPGEAPEAA